jgi:hypothetical protein
MARGGGYAELFTLQARAYLDDADGINYSQYGPPTNRSTSLAGGGASSSA